MGATTFNRAVRGGLSECHLNTDLLREERKEPCRNLGRVFLMKETACAEALRLDHTW